MNEVVSIAYVAGGRKDREMLPMDWNGELIIFPDAETAWDCAGMDGVDRQIRRGDLVKEVLKPFGLKGTIMASKWMIKTLKRRQYVIQV